MVSAVTPVPFGCQKEAALRLFEGGASSGIWAGICRWARLPGTASANCALLQLDGFVFPILGQFRAPDFMRALVLALAESDRRPEPQVEIPHRFQRVDD